MADLFTEIFNWLPLAHCINNKILVSQASLPGGGVVMSPDIVMKFQYCYYKLYIGSPGVWDDILSLLNKFNECFLLLTTVWRIENTQVVDDKEYNLYFSLVNEHDILQYSISY